MKNRRVETYDELPQEWKVKHDIGLALLHLHAPPELTQINKVKVITIHRMNPQQTVRVEELHEVFRYGIPINSDGLITVELMKILDWIVERLT